MSFFCCRTSFLLAIWFCIYTHAQLKILKFQDSVYQKAEVGEPTLNERRKSKHSVVLLGRQLFLLCVKKKKIKRTEAEFPDPTLFSFYKYNKLKIQQIKYNNISQIHLFHGNALTKWWTQPIFNPWQPSLIVLAVSVVMLSDASRIWGQQPTQSTSPITWGDNRAMPMR